MGKFWPLQVLLKGWGRGGRGGMGELGGHVWSREPTMMLLYKVGRMS